MNLLKLGQTMTFGAYPQTASGNDSTPILWRALDHAGGELFLLSEYILDCKPYHGECTDIVWRDCDLRMWLNHEFFDVAFNPTEKGSIVTTVCADNGEGSPNTQDKVFVLSVAEVRAFTSPNDDSATLRRRTVGTEFAKVRKADGCRLYVYDKGVDKDYIEENGEKRGCSWWWTRTQLQIANGRSSRAAFIGARSNIKSYGRVDIIYYGVRPAVKLRLS